MNDNPPKPNVCVGAGHDLPVPVHAWNAMRFEAPLTRIELRLRTAVPASRSANHVPAFYFVVQERLLSFLLSRSFQALELTVRRATSALCSMAAALRLSMNSTARSSTSGRVVSVSPVLRFRYTPS